ncbi:MAG: M36 family metallopeptidase [Chitinophagaceae bacterium]
MNFKKTVIAFVLFFNQLFAQDIDKAKAFELIKNNSKKLNIIISESQVPIITNAYLDEKTELTFIYFQQNYKGIKVYNKIQTAVFKSDQLQYHSGKFVNKIAAIAPSSNPLITAKNAAINAIRYLQILDVDDIAEVNDLFNAQKIITFSKGNFLKRNIKAELLWMMNDSTNEVNLVWAVSLSPINSSDNWNIKIDAFTGNIVEKINETIYETAPHSIIKPTTLESDFLKIFNKEENFEPIVPPPTTTSALYNVVRYPYENRFANGVAIETNPWNRAGVGNNAITYGWHFDGSNNYNTTRGNNVFAYDDSLNIDAPGRWTTSNTAMPNLNFNFTPDFSQPPTTTSNRNFATTNLFYWNNVLHDVTYQYGFTEAAGNFQKDNLGRGGLGNDFVLAEAQDGGGVNNANFWANPDGDTAIMQMYLFNSALNLKILSPSVISGSYSTKEGAISAVNLLKNTGPKTGQIVYYNDNATGTLHTACSTAFNNLSGKIALIKYTQQTGCTFTQRVKNAQNAGAIGVIIIYNTNKPITMGGNDNSITIPAVMIGLDDGIAIEGQLLVGNTVNATLQTGIQFDGDIDNGIVCHEYGHGISIRLTGGAANSSCLNNAEQAGEGWSDYLALMMTTTWSTATINDGNIKRPIGVYAFNQVPNGYGIRTFPYTTDMSINPHTYLDMATNGQVHYIGEIWCSALWDMTWEIIKQENVIGPNLYNSSSIGGNVIALNLVMLGLKLQPCSPGFLDSRDAILAADDILYGGRHKCTIWKAFARRGMGFSAKQGASTSTNDQIAAFDVPMNVELSNNDNYRTIPSTGTIEFNIKATCQCKTPANNYKIKAIIPAGFTYASSSNGVSNADSAVFSNINFSKPFQSDSIKLSLTASSTGCALDTIINDNRDTKTTGGFISAIILGTNGWNTTTQFSYSPTTAWQSEDVDALSEQTLTSNVFSPIGLSLLSFWHTYDFEPVYDGGLVEVSVNNGTTWQPIDNNFIQSGYNTIIDASAPLANQSAFSGSINGFQNSIANITPFAGKNLKLRFRTGTDVGNFGLGNLKGWVVDDVTVTNGCGAFVKFYVYDSANNLLDSTSTPVYITPKILPVQFGSFYAKASGKKSLLQWTLLQQTNTKEYIIERSKDGMDWKAIGNVSAINKSTYSFYDENPIIENYYRIKAVDFNSTINFSGIAKVNFTDLNVASLNIVPNPANDFCKVFVTGKFKAMEIKIFDALGKMVLRQTPTYDNDSYFKVNTSVLKKGTYSISIFTEDGKILTEKLVLIK